MRDLSILCVICCAAIVCAGDNAEAATFGCAKPRSRTQHVVCGWPYLVRAEKQLAAAYAKALRSVSAKGQHLFRKGQRQWRAYARAVCLDSHPRDDYKAAACLETELDRRITQLQIAVQRLGPFIIQRVETFSAIAARSEGADAVTVTVATPRIDNPVTASQRAWNATVAAKIRRLAIVQDSITNNDVDYEFRFVGTDLISLTLTESDFVKGAAHGGGLETTVNWLLRRKREVTIRDMFGEGRDDPALSKLENECKDQLRDGANVEPGDLAPAVAKTIRDMSAWQFFPSDADAVIHFGLYVIGSSYSQGMLSCSIPYDKLRSLVRSDFPLPQ